MMQSLPEEHNENRVPNLYASTSITPAHEPAGLSTSYVLAKNPLDPTGITYVLAKVVNVPDANDVLPKIYPNTINVPHSYMRYDFSETPLHLCDPASLLTQHRCSNRSLPYRVIDRTRDSHTQQEIDWYADPQSKIPPPLRLVMISKLRCYLCGDYQTTEDDIHYESVGEHTYGYRYCTECRPYFLKSLHKSIAPILQFRHKYEEWIKSKDCDSPTPFVWVPRTRRDANGKRIVGGKTPYRYTKWRVINWVIQKHDFPRISQEDGVSVVNLKENCLICEEINERGTFSFEMERITKIVPLIDMYITNFGLISDPEYNPNNDDPLNKYSYEQQLEMFDIASATHDD
jgi:hypothetical protein